MKNLRVSRRKEIIKVRAEINEKETKETIAKVQKTKSWFFEKTNKIDRLIKEKSEKFTANIIFKGEKLKTFSLRSGIKQGCSPLPL